MGRLYMIFWTSWLQAVAVMRLRVPSFAEALILFEYQTLSFGSSNVPARNLYLMVAKLPLKNWTRHGSKSRKMMIKFVLTVTKEPKLWQKAVTNIYGCSRCMPFNDFVYDDCNYRLLYTNYLFHFYVFVLRINLNKIFNQAKAYNKCIHKLVFFDHVMYCICRIWNKSTFLDLNCRKHFFGPLISKRYFKHPGL